MLPLRVHDRVAIGVRPLHRQRDDVAGPVVVGEVQVVRRSLVLVHNPEHRVPLVDVEHASGLHERGDDLAPPVDVRKPSERASRCVDDVERLSRQRLGEVARAVRHHPDGHGAGSVAGGPALGW